MTTDRNEAPDLNRIRPERDADCRYWSDKLGVSVDELRRAVAEVGERPEDVERFLRGPGDTSPNGASHWRATSGL